MRSTLLREQLELYSVTGKFTGAVCRPFLKWPGGKRQLLPELHKRMPKVYGRYFEPFVGGGALFFSVRPTNGYISDVNPELVNAYRVVQKHVEPLILSLRKHRNDEKYFYEIRELDRRPGFVKSGNVERASRMIFLNKTCFNGLHRMNSDGHFNVPFGRYKKPNIVDDENLRACSMLLRSTKIVLGTFEDIESEVAAGDFVYFDPPYLPISSTSSFTKYYKDDFAMAAQIALRDLCVRLDKKGVKFMLSNSFARGVQELYKGFPCDIVKANRAINCNGSGRGKINELIITNYDWHDAKASVSDNRVRKSA